jgi:hypothetical protein
LNADADDSDTLSKEHQKIKEEINRLKVENANISYDKWIEELTRLRDRIQNIAERNFPSKYLVILRYVGTGISLTMFQLDI